MRWIHVFGLLCGLSVVACGDSSRSSDCEAGAEGCPCDAGACGDGLVCEQDVCKPSGGDSGDSSSDATTEDGGSGGSTGSGGDDGTTSSGTMTGTTDSSSSGGTTAGSTGSSTGTTGGVGVCGDGQVGGSEECDDGDSNEANGCANDCTKSGGSVWVYSATPAVQGQFLQVAANGDILVLDSDRHYVVETDGSFASEVPVPGPTTYPLLLVLDSGEYVVGSGRTVIRYDAVGQEDWSYTMDFDPGDTPIDAFVRVGEQGGAAIVGWADDPGAPRPNTQLLQSVYVSAFGIELQRKILGFCSWSGGLPTNCSEQGVAGTAYVDAAENVYFGGQRGAPPAMAINAYSVLGSFLFADNPPSSTWQDGWRALTSDASGNIYAAGINGGIATRKLTGGGTELWQDVVAKVGMFDRATAIAVDSQGAVVVGGTVGASDPMTGGDSWWLGKYSADGMLWWSFAQDQGAGDGEQVFDLAFDAQDNIIVLASGYFAKHSP